MPEASTKCDCLGIGLYCQRGGNMKTKKDTKTVADFSNELNMDALEKVVGGQHLPGERYTRCSICKRCCYDENGGAFGIKLKCFSCGNEEKWEKLQYGVLTQRLFGSFFCIIKRIFLYV
mgnify:CR=1 FL=1